MLLTAIAPGMVKSVENALDNGISSVEDVFESLSSGFLVEGDNESSRLTESVMAPSSFVDRDEVVSSLKETESTSKKTNYPTLKEIAGDYGINIKEDRYENGSSTKSETLDASGIETFYVSGGKIKYLSYSMSYDASTGYASATSGKYCIEAYFKYKNGKVSVDMRESIYNDNGIGGKVERAISGNKIS